MKKMKELRLEDLNTRQKLGMAMVASVTCNDTPEQREYMFNMIRNHSLGAVWVNINIPDLEEVMKKIKDIADYPILILTDAESGLGEYRIGRHNTLGCTGNPDLAYHFGKITALTAKKMGYNVVCNPVLDMNKVNSVCGRTVRSFGCDKHKVAELAIAEAQGMKDCGILTVGKHYPSSYGDSMTDSHMAECLSYDTKEKLLDYNLYPYLQLNKLGLLDGIMTTHTRLPNIDPDYPASLSKKVISIIREQGFNGFTISDALPMMGIVAKFGDRTSKGLAIENGNDLALVFCDTKFSYEAICETYDNGLISDERLDEAVTHVLEAQHKTLDTPKYTEITDEDIKLFKTISRDAIFARTDEGLDTEISREGKHYFVVLTESDLDIESRNKVAVDTLYKDWYHPQEIMDRLEKDFPNSKAVALNQFPAPNDIRHVLRESVAYDDVVCITFVQSTCYIGRECFTSRIVSLINAWQVTNRVSTIVHFGNPFVIEELDHIPRIIIGNPSNDSVNYAIDILEGKYPAKGVLTYDVKYK